MTLQNSKHDWGYLTEPSTTGALGMRQPGQNPWPRGKMLGGTSSMNAMIYVRGNRRDYDNWAASGNAGWGYESVLPYFRKSEDNGADANTMTAKYHGRGGELRVNFMQDVVPLRAAIVDGLAEIGVPWVDDISGDIAVGASRMQTTSTGHTRWSTARAFLVPAANRTNLHIVKHAHVTRLHYADESAKRVDGVEFRIDGHTRTLKAKTAKEVILSAGTLNTPQILMLSGIGPRQHLSELGIKVHHDLAVGEHLQDHLWFTYIHVFHGASAKPYTGRDMLNTYYDYVTNRTGFLSTIGLTDFGLFVNTLNDSEYPDIQYHMAYIQHKQPNYAYAVDKFGYNKEISESLKQSVNEGDVIIWLPTLLNPRSSGTVKLRSRRALDSPLLQHNYLAEQADVDTVVRSIRLIQKFEKTNAFKRHNGRAYSPKLSACDALASDSDEYWECYVRYMSSTLYHPTGTTPMGPLASEGAVVNAALEVHGVQGVRVVDAGIMPQIVSGNTNAPTIMIGEKAADMVKASWSQRDEL